MLFFAVSVGLSTEENRGLRAQVTKIQNRLVASEQKLQALRLQIQFLAAKQDQMLQSRSWRIAQRFQHIRLRLFPPGSCQAKWLGRLVRLLFGWLRKDQKPVQAHAQIPNEEDSDYAAWIIENEPSKDDLAQQQAVSQTFTSKPLFSIIVPVYNPGANALRETLQSVLNQTYPNWELCLVDGNSNAPAVKETLKEFADQDSRVHMTRLEKNLGISGNTNEGLRMAHGEFVVFLDHDDVLAPFALFEVARRLNEDPNWDVIYSDHDVLSADGTRRAQPLFKPDWSPEIMLSANYLTHLTVIRATLVAAVGGFQPELDGAQDWDLFLRIMERTQKIAHIPRVLYHWRESPGSTAVNIYAKAYAPPAQLKAIQGHLARLGLAGAKAFFDSSGFIRVAWAVPKTVRVSIIIPSNGSNRLLEKCVQSILARTAYSNYEIIIVNNGVRKPAEFKYYQSLAREPRVRLVHFDEKFNYSAVNNFGARVATGEILLFLNNDTEIITPDWLDELVLWTQRPAIGVVGAKLLKEDGTIQHAGVVIGLTGFAGHPFADSPEGRFGIFGCAEWYRNFSAVTGALMAVRRDVFENVGGFSEKFILCGSDVEFSLRLQTAGYRVLYNPFVRVKHLESATRGTDIPAQDFQISFQCYLPILQAGDPYFNPNLSYWDCQPHLRKKSESEPLDFTRAFVLRQGN